MSDKEEEKSERKEDILVPLNLSNIYVMICPKCGSLYPEKYKFCTRKECFTDKKGTRLIYRTKCSSCDNDLSEYIGKSEIKYCPECGKALPEKQSKAINKGFERKEKESWENGTERYCETCGKTYRDGEEVCPECGIILVDIKCGCGTAYIKKESGEYNKYCPTCGQITPFGKISTNVGQATVPQSVVHQYNVGDKITFGNYPFYEDGREKTIDWIILDIDANGNALLISDYALDNVRYSEEYKSITWENSTIRQWLNETFINRAFSVEQRSKIINIYLANNDNAKYKTRGGNDTTDNLFLLSIEEVRKYFKNDKERVAVVTPYAESKGAWTINYLKKNHYSNLKDEIREWETAGLPGGSCWWWLRSPGYNQLYAADVSSDGDVDSRGYYVSDSRVSVRPAFRINLNNL